MKRGMTMTLMLAVVVAALAAPVALYPMYTGVRARLCPGGTVTLARSGLRERVSAPQLAGVALALSGVALPWPGSSL